jgi:hypothetical protein
MHYSPTYWRPHDRVCAPNGGSFKQETATILTVRLPRVSAAPQPTQNTTTGGCFRREGQQGASPITGHASNQVETRQLDTFVTVSPSRPKVCYASGQGEDAMSIVVEIASRTGTRACKECDALLAMQP